MYKIILSCSGVPASAGPSAAADISAEFSEHRHWHKNVRCTWDGTKLILEAENEFDPKGLALLDEFSDCVCAYVQSGDWHFDVESVSQVELDGGEPV